MQGSEGDKKGHLNFHFHHRNVPKGCLAITVGQGPEQRRFIIPVIYVNHPLFTQLLKDAEEEYGFYQRGTINIPCHVEDFCEVRGMIDKETMPHHHHHHNHHHHHFLCFKA
ncbi:auxin-responsive protein SAUR32-like [Primulina tabacum]|uniref:auxin-responsive protein SAUR32-like n=1 Tax=Primulina tabacum TaxID=48773 RepID=UPI003F59198B